MLLRHWTPARAYAALAAVVSLLMVEQTLSHKWSNIDPWVWLGAIREFSERPLHPHHPLLAADAADSYLGPYTFVLGMVSRWFRLDPLTVMTGAALCNLALLILGIRYLAKRVSPQPWTAPLLLAFTLVAWGRSPWLWAGYPSLYALGPILPLGSTAAYGAALFGLGSLWQWLATHRRRNLITAAACLVLALLTHQMTGLWAGLIAAGIVAAQGRLIDAKSLIELIVTALIAAGAVLAWPFYSFAGLLTRTGGFDAINAPTYRLVLLRSFLVLPGIAVVYTQVRRRDYRLALPVAGLATVFAVGWVLQKGSVGRVFPGLVLVLHLAMAAWFAERLDANNTTTRTRRRWAGALAAILLIGTLGTAKGWLRSVPEDLAPASIVRRLGLDSEFDPNRGFTRYLRPDDVVASVDGASLPIGGYAAKVVAVGIPAPFVNDSEERVIDIRMLLAPDTPLGDRLRIVERYRVTAIVVDADSVMSIERALPGWGTSGIVNGFAIIRPGGVGA